VNKARQKFLLIQIRHYKDHQAFTELYESMVDPIYRYIFFRVNQGELAKDITAEVFFRCWKDLTNEGSQTVKHLKAYIYIIARNLVIDHYRLSAKEKTVPLQDALAHPDEKNTHSAVEIQLESEYILRLIQRLKQSYQEILVLKHIEEFSLAEISNIIQKSPVGTRVLLHRANQALKREYEKTVSRNV